MARTGRGEDDRAGGRTEKEQSSAQTRLKVFCERGPLVILATGKDASGRVVTREYRVQGPVLLIPSAADGQEV